MNESNNPEILEHSAKFMTSILRVVAQRLWLMALFVGMLAPILCHGHYWNVHERITDSACQSSGGLQTFLSENLEANSLTASYQEDGDGMFNNTVSYTPSMWLQCGSIMEDEELYNVLSFPFTLRVMDHFYDVNGSVLSNDTNQRAATSPALVSARN